MRKIIWVQALILSALFLLAGCAEKELYEKREEAVALYNNNDYENALKLFEEALSYGNGEVSETEFDILRYKAECELRTKRYDEAEKTCSLLAELDTSPESSEMYNKLEAQLSCVKKLNEAVQLSENGEWENAYGIFSEIADLKASGAGKIAWFNKAVCAEHLGNFAEAKELMSEYVRAFPDDQEAVKEYTFLRTR